MASNAGLSSKLSERLKKPGGTAAITEMTFVSGQEYANENTNTERIYQRILAERQQIKEAHRKQMKEKSMDMSRFSQSMKQEQGQDEEMEMEH